MGIKKMIKAIVYCLLFLSLGLFGCSADSMIEGEIKSDSFITYADEAFFTDKFGTSHIKIAFNDENKDELNYIEFDGNTFRHEIIATPATPNHPQFSPDGSKIAFSTGHEGLTGITEMYVVDLAQEGRPVYKLDTENAAIPRWRILENGDTAIIYIDVCGPNHDTLWDISSTFEVTFANNTFGTPYKIFFRSYNGGVTYDNTLAVSGFTSLYYHYGWDDFDVNTDMYNGEQVCNVSMSRDSSKIVSFLETRGKLGQEFTKDTSYHWHQYIFYMDSMGNLLKAIKAKGENVFNGTEWINVSGYQVGAVTTVDEITEDIVLIDYDKETYYPILKARGRQVAFPDLWVDPKRSSPQER